MSSMRKIETHFHTSESSSCGQVPAAEGVRMYREAGYDAVVVTDHFNGDTQGRNGSWEEKVDKLLAGYGAAFRAGEENGMRIYLGMEIRFEENYNDYLVYGFGPEFLYAHPWLYFEGIESFSKIARGEGLCLLQAHPFRNWCVYPRPHLLDGVEGFNGNPDHDSHNDRAMAFAREHGLIWTSGSDFHCAHHLARGGIEMETLPKEEKELADRIRRGEFRALIPDEGTGN